MKGAHRSTMTVRGTVVPIDITEIEMIGDIHREGDILTLVANLDKNPTMGIQEGIMTVAGEKIGQTTTEIETEKEKGRETEKIAVVVIVVMTTTEK